MSLIDLAALRECLEDLGLPDWPASLEPAIRNRLCDEAHGDFPRWRKAIAGLTAEPGDSKAVREHLISLSPWRKGPFSIGGIDIDSEWRSDLKWQRCAAAVEPLEGRAVLDVGSGNGYYALRMRDAGARAVIGIDPTILYVMQFLAVRQFDSNGRVFVLPFRLEQLPAIPRSFDTTFSMGVLYHQRSPLTHLQQLRGTLRPGGQLVLETLFLPGEDSFARTPEDRYARMRNVWLLPTISELTTWLRRSGFRNIAIVDEAVTTTDEQRSTEWMQFESLAEALDPEDPSRTVEGWPAPRRVVAVAHAP
jgi:tRNA (mo5U34)-methyltransferase